MGGRPHHNQPLSSWQALRKTYWVRGKIWPFRVTHTATTHMQGRSGPSQTLRDIDGVPHCCVSHRPQSSGKLFKLCFEVENWTRSARPCCTGQTHCINTPPQTKLQQQKGNCWTIDSHLRISNVQTCRDKTRRGQNNKTHKTTESEHIAHGIQVQQQQQQGYI